MSESELIFVDVNDPAGGISRNKSRSASDLVVLVCIK
jgi:hypothetical protein